MKATKHSFQTLTESHPALDQIVDWLYQEWGKVQGDSSFAIKEKLLLECDCPTSQVAMEETVPVGFIWLNRYQLPEHEKPEIWINGLFIPPEHRRKGIASSLMKRAEQLAKGFEKKMYAYTDIPELYLRQGWQIYKPKDNTGNTTLIRNLECGS
ncbi:MAG: GNAT family N-acetyltransferase [Verrucomicrobia bacterium]|nr:GNAT family N-acetyltransferase [Verrucomicrobiota bacterium]MDA1065026.1 GNAT family N-acetyltransferase [Verrucomicrobiota bacterium]